MKKIFNKEVKIGLAVLVALFVLFFGINYLKGVNIFKAANYYYTSFSNVEGLTNSAPVTLNGFTVGQVRSMEYDYEHPGNVKVELSLDKNLKLPKNSRAVMVTGLLGTATVELQLGQSPDYCSVGENIPGENRPSMLDAVTGNLMPTVARIFPKVDSLITSLNNLASDPALKLAVERIDGITADLRRTTMSVSSMAEQLSTMPARLNPILADAHAITGNVKTMTADLGEASQNVNALTAQLRNMPVDSLLQNIQATTENLKALTAQMNDPHSSLGLLMHDPALYNNLNSTIASLDSLFVDVKRNPKRYVSIKVF